MKPRAKKDGMLSEVIEDETIVYDESQHRGHCLNRTAAVVWQHADGGHTIADLAAILRAEVDPVADENLVWTALDHLNSARLLEDLPQRSADEMRASRRGFISKVGMVGVATLLLPVVTSVTAASDAHARVCSSGSSGGAAVLPAEWLKRG